MASRAGSRITPRIIFILLLTAFASGASAVTRLTFINRCSYMVWPAIVPAWGRGFTGGIELPAGTNGTLDIPFDTGASATKLWGRTGCSFDASGTGRCRTGDCGGLGCDSGSSSDPGAVTEAEFSLHKGKYNYGITTVKGFNLAMGLACSSGGDVLRCREAGCHVAYPYQKHYQHVCSAAHGSRLQVVFCA
ncbi:hypothetical protein QYE76_000573 [Lolium multiflorum]|uniref:Thaumatin-like protein n=1 Tax=Lolium multiflorum TaxID=4521 RepID=A0AAD8RJF3_LOLMU|nr:hypothetical protein QYE76_000573 [Lolium multiflorum]